MSVNLSFPIPKCNSCKDPLTDTDRDTTWKNCDNCRTTREDYLNRSMQRLDHLNSTTSLHAPSPIPSHYRDPSGSSRLADDQTRRSSASALPPPAEAIEYQWSDGLIEALLALPPRSKHIGKFSIIADPTVNNSTRAHLFLDQLHARAVPISDWSQPISMNVGSSNACALGSYCTCQEGCQGQFVISVDDDTSHPYGVPGQRIAVIVVHPSPPD